MSQTPNSSACRPLTPPQSFTVASRDSYHWSPLSPAFSLSSVHSLQPLSTYLVPTEQCRWRRTLKDRLDCLGILISPFFLHTSWSHALLCCILLRCFSPNLFTQNCVFGASWLKEKSSFLFSFLRCGSRKVKTVELPSSTRCLQFFCLRTAALLHLQWQRHLCLGRSNYRASLPLWKSMKLNSLSLTTWKSTIAQIPQWLRQHAAKPASCIFYQSRCVL